MDLEVYGWRVSPPQMTPTQLGVGTGALMMMMMMSFTTPVIRPSYHGFKIKPELSCNAHYIKILALIDMNFHCQYILFRYFIGILKHLRNEKKKCNSFTLWLSSKFFVIAKEGWKIRYNNGVPFYLLIDRGFGFGQYNFWYRILKPCHLTHNNYRLHGAGLTFMQCNKSKSCKNLVGPFHIRGHNQVSKSYSFWWVNCECRPTLMSNQAIAI